MEFLSTYFVTLATLPYGNILMGMFGGLALFLWGMELMSNALKAIAGDQLRTSLKKLTKTPFSGVLAGAFVTAIIQSSSITTVLVVGFISAGLMTFSQSIGIIIGANIGTTMTAQIIAFKVTHYALALVAAGFGTSFFFKHEKTRQYGKLVLGLGLIFLGMSTMSNSTHPLQSFTPFIEWMKHLNSPLMGIAFGALFTAIIQSSSATTGIVIVLASQGFLSLDAGISLVFGANIGTCFTAWLASLGQNIEAKRAVLAHILFNLTGVAIWFFFIPQLAEFVRFISPHAEQLDDVKRIAAETPRQIANAHTIFNIANALIFIGFIPLLASFIRRILPTPPHSQNLPFKPKYLSNTLLKTPALALEGLRRELSHMGNLVSSITCHAIETISTGDDQSLTQLKKEDRQIDELHKAIILYIKKLFQQPLDEQQSSKLQQYLFAANHLENIADAVESRLVHTGFQRLQSNLSISDSTQTLLTKLQKEVCQEVCDAIKALTDNDFDLAQKVIQDKSHINQLADQAEQHLIERLHVNEPHRVTAFRLESEIISHLKRIYYLAKRIAKTI